VSIRFKHTWMTSIDASTIDEVVEEIIYSAPDYHDGELESMRRKLEKLTEIVGLMAASLPEDQQATLAGSLRCVIAT
jgi:hypothetical protein